MHDYMKALQRQFESKSESLQELTEDIHQTHKQLSAHLEKEDRKLLLKLVDMEGLLHCKATLHSFISGYRLACGVHRELAEYQAYSFDQEEEWRASQALNVGDSNIGPLNKE